MCAGLLLEMRGMRGLDGVCIAGGDCSVEAIVVERETSWDQD